MRLCCLISALAPAIVHAQFGNLNVQWPTSSSQEGTAPRLASDPLRDYKAPKDARRLALAALGADDLSVIATQLGAACETCESTGHWVSLIRSAVLSLAPNAIQRHLTKRGVRCKACTTREALIDRLLDTVHLPHTS
jgi:hypothetical protein